MFINYQLLFDKELTFEDLNMLFQINQKEDVLLESKDFTKLEELGLVTYLKAPKEKHLSIRLSKNGKTFLDALTTKGLTEEISELVEELVKIYSFNDKESGNHLEIQKRLIWFIEETGFGPQAIKNMVEKYVEGAGEFVMRLDNLIWKPQSVAFSIHYNLKDSRLFEMFVKQFKLPIHFLVEQKRKVEDIWLWEVSKLKIPKKLPSELYFTGSYKGDSEFLEKIKVSLYDKIY